MTKIVQLLCAFSICIFCVKARALDPNSFTSLGTFNPGGAVLVNTDTLAMTGGASFTGVVSGNIAVFTFTSVNLSSGITVTASGSRSFALLSRGGMTINGQINASAVGASGGPGGGAGNSSGSGGIGSGPGAGGGDSQGGGGGGFGGAGGSTSAGAPAGLVYGDLATLLQGGSGGGKGTFFPMTSGSGGGGGGGLELAAIGTLDVQGSGQIRASGAAGGTVANDDGGGGGSGGGIYLHALVLNLAASAQVQAMGGNGGNAGPNGIGGGGGGGGRVRLEYSGGNLSSIPNVGGGGGSSGGFGTGLAGTTGSLVVVLNAPEVAVSGNGINIVDGDATPSLADHTDFGNLDITTDFLTRTFTISNSGTSVLSVANVILAGAHAADFSVDLQPVSPIAPGGSTTFQIKLNPSVVGVRTATLSFANNDADESPFNFTIQGTGTGMPEIAVTGNGTNIADGDASPSLADHTDFGVVVLNGGSLLRTYMIANVGNADLTLSAGSISSAGAHAADFNIGGISLPTTIAPASNTTFTVNFDPSAVGVRLAEINIASNDGDENPFNFIIQGTGAAADVQISKTNFESGLLPGRDTVYLIQVLNAGPDTVSSVRVVDDVPNSELANAVWTCTSVPPSLCPNASGGPDIDQTTGALPNGALLQYTLIATPTGMAPAFITNAATVTNNDGSDPNTTNNSASDTDPIVSEGIFKHGFEPTSPPLLATPIDQ